MGRPPKKQTTDAPSEQPKEPTHTPQSPDQTFDETDPGDDTQLRFRYQHGYGVILLIASVAGQLKYLNLWCEHHDDFLAQLDDGRFDSYQIKTAQPEQGPWDLRRDGLLSAFQKFVLLDGRFADQIASFSFVSNADCLDSEAFDKIAKSPVRLCRAIGDLETSKQLKPPFEGVVTDLAGKCECDGERMFRVLKRTRLVKGPPLDAFESCIAHEHLPQVSHCAHLTAPILNALRDELMQRVFDASSLKIDDPSKHWWCVTALNGKNPRLLAKRVDVSVIAALVQEPRPIPFRFAPASTALKLQDARSHLSVLQKKLLKAGLASQLDTMQHRTLSTEQHLLSLAASKPDDISVVLNQLRSVVKGICDDATVTAQSSGSLYGPQMMTQVLGQLRQTSTTRPTMVCSQEYECLVGVAGLLTEECDVWWGPHFDVDVDL